MIPLPQSENHIHKNPITKCWIKKAHYLQIIPLDDNFSSHDGQYYISANLESFPGKAYKGRIMLVIGNKESRCQRNWSS